MKRIGRSWAALAVIALSACNFAGEGEPTEAQRGDGSDTIELAEFPDRPYWGDTHLHTDISVDAFGFGVRLGAEEALKFGLIDQVVDKRPALDEDDEVTVGDADDGDDGANS